MRLKNNHRFQHGKGRRVGSCICATGLAENVIDFGEALQDAICDLQEALRFGNRDAGHGGRHVQQRAFLQRRHEFRTDSPEQRNRENDQRYCAHDHLRLVAQCPTNDRIIEPHQRASDGMLFLWANLATQ